MSQFKKTVFRGAATALITPFRDGKIDFGSLSSMIERQINAGIDALVIAGTTGENCTLSDVEHHELLTRAIEYIGGRVPAIAGTGSNDTAHAVEMSQYAASLGYDALLVVTPYYNKATPQGLIKSYFTIADASDAPIILYNVPSRTGCNITLPVYRELARHENIVAVKEASGSISAVAQLIDECGHLLDVYSGNDDQTLPLLALGGAGVISVASNIIPREMVELCRLWFEGEWEQSRQIQMEYLSLMNTMFCEVNPIPVKAAAAMMGLCTGELRLPLCPPSEENKQKIAHALKEAGVIK
jgi:4-hydroxy-tetrahydrodipicolinate synthase